MVLILPFTIKEIKNLPTFYLEEEEDRWVYGNVYKKNEECFFHLDEINKIITLCCPKYVIYLQYHMTTLKLTKIIETSSCWANDYTSYYINSGFEIYNIEEKFYGHNLHSLITIENNKVKTIDFNGIKFGNYQLGDIINTPQELISECPPIIQLFQSSSSSNN